MGEEFDLTGPDPSLGVDSLGGMTPEQLMLEARKLVDPKAKFRAAGAAALKPTASPHFSEAYGNAMGAFAEGKNREDELAARYAPIVQQAAINRQRQQLLQQQQARTAIDTTMASLLMEPTITPETVTQAMQGLVAQGRVPMPMAQAYMKGLPKDPAALRGYLQQQAIAVTDPYRAVKAPTFEKLGEGDQGFLRDPITNELRKVGEGGAKSSDFSRTLSQLMAMDPNDPRRPAMQAYLNKLMTHPPNSHTIIMPEKPFLTNFMGGLGEAAASGRTAASAAKTSFDTASRLAEALATNKAITGPGATGEVFLRQIAEAAGFGGKTNREKLANTRNAIQSLAQLELDAAGQIKGQGAITENERALLKKVAGGTIELTRGELEELIAITKRTARIRIRQYNDYARRIAKLPGMAEVAPLLEVSDPEDDAAITQTGPGGGPLIDGSKYLPRRN